MNANEYQSWTETTAIYPKEFELSYLALGLVGEAGEIANHIKKVLRDYNGKVTDEMKKTLINELGDVEWYIARLCEFLGTTIEDVMQINFEKLESRKKRNVLKGSGDNR